MENFKQIGSDDEIKKVIKAAFDSELDVRGAWGYTEAEATIIKRSKESKNMQHTLASMRAYLEMNMTLGEDERYGSININEKSRKSRGDLEEITYEISAMKEKDYAAFINEYKKEYGKSSFNMSEHFQKRKDATLIREVKHFFKLI